MRLELDFQVDPDVQFAVWHELLPGAGEMSDLDEGSKAQVDCTESEAMLAVCMQTYTTGKLKAPAEPPASTEVHCK